MPGANIVEEPLVYTVEEAAQLLRISKQTAYEAIKADEIPCIRVRKRILVPRKALLELLERGFVPFATGDSALTKRRS